MSYLAKTPEGLLPRHGTVKGYNYGCRCRACAAAKSEYMRRRRPPLRLEDRWA